MNIEKLDLANDLLYSIEPELDAICKKLSNIHGGLYVSKYEVKNFGYIIQDAWKKVCTVMELLSDLSMEESFASQHGLYELINRYHEEFEE